MLTFWALLDGSDIEAYVSGLLLPPYMSHLRRSPLLFESQPPNPDGRQPLLITYLGDGRVEEFPIHPKKHALNLLRSVCPNMDPTSVRISESESIWNWDRDSERMKLYFEPVSDTLKVDFPPRFDPRHCHVSVSRKEMFLGRDVLRGYFGAWLDRLEGKKERRNSSFVLETISGGVRFQDEQIGGEFLLEEGAVFNDLLHFSGLSRTLRDLAELVKLDLDDSETEICEDGFRFHLVPA